MRQSQSPALSAKVLNWSRTELGMATGAFSIDNENMRWHECLEGAAAWQLKIPSGDMSFRSLQSVRMQRIASMMHNLRETCSMKPPMYVL